MSMMRNTHSVFAASDMDGRGLKLRSSTNVDRKGSAAMLTSIQSAGVAPEMNFRNSLHEGNKTCKRGIHSGFETQGRRPKQGYQWPHEKDVCVPKH